MELKNRATSATCRANGLGIVAQSRMKSEPKERLASRRKRQAHASDESQKIKINRLSSLRSAVQAVSVGLVAKRGGLIDRMANQELAG